ncbi:hypothetical protein BS78_04G111600 [Paspalum vaginatum]|nr:hypothetical protein BS78_04G111600 [Paspalum vaginatum]
MRKTDQGLLAWVPLLHVQCSEIFAHFHLHRLPHMQHNRSLLNNPDEHNRVFFNKELEARRPPSPVGDYIYSSSTAFIHILGLMKMLFNSASGDRLYLRL